MECIRRREGGIAKRGGRQVQQQQRKRAPGGRRVRIKQAKSDAEDDGGKRNPNNYG